MSIAALLVTKQLFGSANMNGQRSRKIRAAAYRAWDNMNAEQREKAGSRRAMYRRMKKRMGRNDA